MVAVPALGNGHRLSRATACNLVAAVTRFLVFLICVINKLGFELMSVYNYYSSYL